MDVYNFQKMDVYQEFTFSEPPKFTNWSNILSVEKHPIEYWTWWVSNDDGIPYWTNLRCTQQFD